MYDIKSVSISGDKVELLAIHDTKEEYILEKIKKAVSNGMSENSNLPNLLVKLFSLIYAPPAFGHNFLLEETQENNFHSFFEIFFSHISKVTSPPPEII